MTRDDIIEVMAKAIRGADEECPKAFIFSHHLDAARAALAAIEAAGVRLVPETPTTEMCRSADAVEWWPNYTPGGDFGRSEPPLPSQYYAAMLKASPFSP